MIEDKYIVSVFTGQSYALITACGGINGDTRAFDEIYEHLKVHRIVIDRQYSCILRRKSFNRTR